MNSTLRGGVKPSSNATLSERVRRFFESIQVLSSRINEVHCGIFEHIKRYRNTSRKTIINCFTRQSGMTPLVKCVAFTLAETLVVMGIIGVVAALTIPNLNQSTGDRERVAKVKKIYSNLVDAFGRAQAVYGPYDEWCQQGNDCATRRAERITEFMKVSKVCKSTSGCFSTSPYYSYDGGDSWSEYADNRDKELLVGSPYNVILADGTSVAFLGGPIYVDIDGPNKGPNKEGVDNFGFSIATQDVNGNTVEPYIALFGNDVKIELTGDFDYMFPLAWIIQNGNMDYLKCPDDLNWETKTSCK